jgi:putative transposase
MNHTTHTPGARYRIGSIAYELTGLDGEFFIFRAIEFNREKPISRDRFDKMLEAGDIVLIQKALPDVTDAHYINALSEEQKEKFYRRLKYVQKAYQEFGPTIPKRAYKNFIRRCEREFEDPSPPSFSQLYRWMDDYRKAGCSPAGLLNKHDKGKPRSRRLDDRVIELMNRFIKEDFLNDQEISMRLVFDSLSDEIKYSNLDRPEHDQLSVPSYMTFVREIKKIHPMSRDRARLGKYATRKKYAYGKPLRVPDYFLSRVEADSNYMDIQILDEYGSIIGRPWLLALIDVYTRCLLGWDLSFIPPSAEKVLNALRHAGSVESEREVGGFPIDLIVDNGPEFNNGSLTTFSKHFGFNVHFVQPKSPNEKAHIESFFDTMNKRFLHTLPGTTFSNPSNRGDYDSEGKAVMTLEALREYFATWVDNVYHLERHSGIETRRPREMWREASKYFPPNLYPKIELDIQCQRVIHRVIRNGKIQIHNLYWTSPTLPVLAAKIENNTSNNKVEVMYDVSDLSKIWVRDPLDSQRIYQADATRPHLQHSLSLYEWEELRKQNYYDGDASEMELVKARRELYIELSDLRHKSKKVRKKAIRIKQDSSYHDNFLEPHVAPSIKPQKSSLRNNFQTIDEDYPDTGFFLEDEL